MGPWLNNTNDSNPGSGADLVEGKGSRAVARDHEEFSTMILQVVDGADSVVGHGGGGLRSVGEPGGVPK